LDAALELLNLFEISHAAKILDLSKPRALKMLSVWQAAGGRLIIAADSASANDNRKSPGFAENLTDKVGLPVLIVPCPGPSAARSLAIVRSLLRRRRQPPFAALAIGESGAKNAALAAVSILALTHPQLRRKLVAYRKKLAAAVHTAVLPHR
jgi:5-(carboxyamino)imidazole ribonucleotide mutase